MCYPTLPAIRCPRTCTHQGPSIEEKLADARKLRQREEKRIELASRDNAESQYPSDDDDDDDDDETFEDERDRGNDGTEERPSKRQKSPRKDRKGKSSRKDKGKGKEL
jgi:hypothetical protein